jgi:hypothetical protein
MQRENLLKTALTMTILESQFEHTADAIAAGAVLHFEYDLKFEIVLKEATIFA